jgi:anti-anti-sigma factor
VIAMPELTGPLLEHRQQHGVLVVTVNRKSIQGEAEAEALRQELLEVVQRSGLTRIVIDLSRTRYVSSIAFWPLLSLRKRMQESGGRLLICGLTGAVADVFHTTKMVGPAGSADAPFEEAADQTEAVALLAGSAPA